MDSEAVKRAFFQPSLWDEIPRNKGPGVKTPGYFQVVPPGQIYRCNQSDARQQAALAAPRTSHQFYWWNLIQKVTEAVKLKIVSVPTVLLPAGLMMN